MPHQLTVGPKTLQKIALGVYEVMEPASELLLTLMQSLPDAFVYQKIIQDPDGTPVDYLFLEVNAAFMALAGLSVEKIVGLTFKTLLPQLDGSAFDWAGTFARAALCNGCTIFRKYHKLLKRWYEITACNNGSGYLVLLFRLILDSGEGLYPILPEAKQEVIGQELTEAHLRLLIVMDSMDARVFVSDLQSCELLYVNAYGSAMCNRGNTRILGEKCWEVFQHGQTVFCKSCPVDRLVDEEGLPAGVYRWEHWDSYSGRWFYCQDRAIEWVDGRMAHLQIATDITDLKDYEGKLKSSLEENEVLLRETHHRVKNNLSVIISLIDMQRRLLEDGKTAAMLQELSNRIFSMALVHEKLYRSKRLSRINMHAYLQTLVSHLYDFSQLKENVNICVEAQGVEMDLDTAIPCGLIVHETVSNALKHAFPGGAAGSDAMPWEISVRLEQEGCWYRLEVTDNGIGLPPHFDLKRPSSIGFRLVQMLGEHQLGGRIEVGRSLDGTGTKICLYFT